MYKGIKKITSEYCLVFLLFVVYGITNVVDYFKGIIDSITVSGK
jgi:hypothetical protein